MSSLLEKSKKAYDILKEYKGKNSYMIALKNSVFAYKNKTLNSFECEYVIYNAEREPIEINKSVLVAEWWAVKKAEEWEVDFTPKKLFITWYLGETKDFHHFFCIYRKSQERAVEVFAPKSAILTPIESSDWKELEIDFTPYEERSGRQFYEHQKEAVKFLTHRKRAILALDMGFGKSLTAIVASLVGNYEHILIISPSSIKKTWENELKYFVDEDDITIVQGSKWKDAKFTIINYDILDNFYTIPTQKVKSKELDVDDKGNVVTRLKEKEIVSRSKKIIDEAMSDSQLFQARYDLIIIDEAHRLSNSSSNRFKILSDLIKRSNPKGVFELTGTMITNSSANLYNLLKIIDVPITRDWQKYMERYCGAKVFYKKNERNAYTAMFLKEVKKNDWYELTYEEKRQLNELLEKKCKKMCIPSEDTNSEELQEIIKPYYLRRTKDELEGMVKKEIVYLHYDMTKEEKESYDKLWDEYIAIQEDKEKAEKYKKLEEASLMRQWLADKMIPKTIKLSRYKISKGHKVIIFCAYDNEIEKLVDEFKNECVFHNGKINEKKKNEAVEKFQNDDNVKVFIGNLQSAGVGLTLVSANVVIFNNFSFVPSDNQQAEDRIHRLNQTKDCTIYYQSFNGTYFDHMLDIVHKKEEIINKIIVSEKEK